jgi:D-xylose ABC transporter substrate-binding protein
MRKFAAAMLAGAALSFCVVGLAHAKGKVIGVSWSNFQEERWKTDEAAMKATIAAAGDKYISADAQSSPQKQLTDIESLIAQGANALIVLAQDSSAVAPAVQKAVDEGIPVIGYDRLIENPNAFYITFDNKEVGRMQARGVFAVKPLGNYAFIKGSSTDPNADFLFSGQMEVLKDAIDSGAVKNVGAIYTDGWLPANAQKNMEQILTKTNNKIDAVVASNDGTAGGAIARRQRAGLRARRRSRSAQPHRARHPDRIGLEGRARARQESSRDRSPPRRRQEDERRARRDDILRRPQEGRDESTAADARSDHQGQSRRRHRGGLDQKGGSLPGREARQREGLRVSG